MHVRVPAIFLAGMLVAPLATALPVLRFALPGNAQTLGAGASAPFINLTQDALQLERPAFLTNFARPEVRLQLETESTIDLAGDQPYSGTRASNMLMRATYVQPITVARQKLWLSASGRYDDAAFTLQNKGESLFVDIREHRTAFQVASAWKPWEKLRIGVSGGFGLGRSFAIEVSHQLGPFEFGFVRRTEQLTFDLLSPPGPKRRIQRPSLTYNVLQTRQVGALTASLQTKWVDIFGSWDGLQGEYRIDTAIKPLSWLTLRGYADSATYRFDEWAQNAGEPILRVNMGVSITRWLLGTEARRGRHFLSLRYMKVSGSTTGAWSDNGAVTGQRLLDVDVDFQLYLRHLYRIASEQWTAGWTRSGERWDVSAGLQHLRIETATGGAVYGSALSTSLSGRDPVAPAAALAIGLTAGVTHRIGLTQLSLSIAQLIPYGTEDNSPKPPPSTEPTKPVSSGGSTISTWEKLKQALDKYGGGRVVVAEVRRTF